MMDKSINFMGYKRSAINQVIKKIVSKMALMKI
ncbi:MAG: hypothetical protein CM1200mP10_17840 [Candidatus Neomarinimicrobiota bacterium]|nr:MAG: hypothetical protein CM1200mP10_17840 [Candidatus Neomarinimicrobiota bacterium]